MQSETISIPIGFDMESYERFLQCKRLPRYQVRGRLVITDPVSYASVFGGDLDNVMAVGSEHMLDFQLHVVKRALSLRRFAALLDCGLGKTPIELEWAHSLIHLGKVLILCPLSVFEQMQRECLRWYGHRLVNLRAGETWTSGIAICNFEGRRHIDMNGVVGIVLDESGILKNDTGETRNYLCDLAKNVPYRLAASATPAPNDHDEYSNQAVFLGLVQSSKDFYARFFRKENNRWILKGHARDPFYKYLSSWSTYIKSPSRLGYDGKTEMKCEPEYIFEQCDLPEAVTSKLGGLFASADNSKDRPMVFGPLRTDPGSDRTQKILSFVSGHKSIIWCARNLEETMFSRALKNSVVINGSMSIEDRVANVDLWRAGKIDHLVSKPSVLGFGINLPECERMVFSGYTYSFEQFYQAVRRAHRYGREGRLKVLLPYVWPELPILNNLKRKMETFQQDTNEIESRFHAKNDKAEAAQTRMKL